MSIGTDSGPPIVLAYANPLAAPPVGGRLSLVRDEKRITLTDSLSYSTSPRLIQWMGIVLLVGGIVMAILCRAGTVDRDHLMAALIAAVCGVPCIFWSRSAKQKLCLVRIESGCIYTQCSLSHDWISGRFRPKRFAIVRGSLDLRTRQFAHTAVVCYRLGFRFSLFAGLSLDEARWAVHLMEQARENSGP